jgi:uncharacterized protein (TIGR03437 family)
VDRVVNSADGKGGGGVAPGEIVTLFPTNAGPPSLAAWPTIFPRTDSDLEYMRQQPHWSSVGTTRVFFDNVAAPIVYAVSGQVETIVPYQVSKSTRIVVRYGNEQSRPVTLRVIESAPAIFTLDGSGKGPAAVLNETGCCNSIRNPATRGSIATLYATGEGRMTSSVGVNVGGVPAEVIYAHNLGMLVVNFRVPESGPVGDAIPLVLTV